MTTAMMIVLAVVLAVAVASVLSAAWNGNPVAWAWAAFGGLHTAISWLFELVSEAIDGLTK